MSALTPADVDAVCDLVHDLCGLCWDESKAYLIESRLGPILQRRGCSSYAELARQVRAAAPELAAEVIAAATTGETRWFRDPPAFDALKFKIIPELIDARDGTPARRRLRIWSAGCSTGQEPYSLAIALAEIIPHIASWDVQILGTDVSAAAVEQAARGVYSQLEMDRGVDPERRQQYFIPQGADQWRVTDKIRACVASRCKTFTNRRAPAIPSTSCSAAT